MTPTWGQLWLRACALVGWRVRAFGRGVVLRRLRRQRRRRPPNERVCISDVVAAAGNPGQIVRVYGKERPMFTSVPGQCLFMHDDGGTLTRERLLRMTERVRKTDMRPPQRANAETEFERNYLRAMNDGPAVSEKTSMGVRSSWANRRPDNYHWRRSAMEE